MTRTKQPPDCELPLFPEPQPVVSVPINTRRLAYNLMAGTKLGKLQAAVLQVVAERGDLGATDEELRKALGRSDNTIRARRTELRDLGLIIDSGGSRKTDAGRLAITWTLPGEFAQHPRPQQTPAAPSKTRKVTSIEKEMARRSEEVTRQRAAAAADPLGPMKSEVELIMRKAKA